MTFSDPSPKLGDSDNILLVKICQLVNSQKSGNFPPESGDSDNNLLFKIANLYKGN
jgi:hypothetical protein